jgi:hypothetical protein
MALTLEAIALHAMKRKNGSKELVWIGVADPAKLTARTRERYTGYLERAALRTEIQGRARAAWWANGSPPQELERLSECSIPDFGAAGEAAMQRLFDKTPGAASEGLALFVRARDGTAPVLGCIKLELGAVHDVRYSGSIDPEKAVEDIDIEGVLPQADKVLKAALIPNPSGASDLRVLDDQLPDPASHWLQFLDANPRPTEAAISGTAAAALRAALTTETTLDDREAAAVVAERLEVVAQGTEPVTAEEFVVDVAEHAEAEPAALWAAAVKEEPEVANEHYEVVPRAAEKLTSTYALGHGIQLTGPTRELDRRVEFVEASGGWLLRLPVDGPVKPDYR